MNVVLYLRYSSSAQTEQSIEGQRTVCQNFCKQKNYKIVNEYVERAKSAFKDTDKRVEFNQMIKDASSGRFDAVIVYKLDRFSRNKYDTAIYKTKLKKYGVRVISATECISDSPEGVILESVLEGMAEYYSMELSQKVKRGMNECALKCNAHCKAPYGYKIINKKYVPDPYEVPALQLIYQLYNQGISPNEIAETLNDKGYRTRQGGLFTSSSFSRIISNPMYIGVYEYNGYRVEDAIEPLIDKDTFNMAQERRTKTHKAPNLGKGKIKYLLSGKLVCGDCGANYQGDCGTSKSGIVHAYYSCRNHKEHHTCDAPSIPKDLIENEVINILYSLITPEMIDRMADMCYKANQEDVQKHSKAGILEERYHQLDRECAGMLDLILKKKLPDIQQTYDRYRELTEQVELAKEEWEDAKQNIIVIDKDMIKYFLSEFLNGNIEDNEYRQRLVDMLVKKITVHSSTMPTDPNDKKKKIKFSIDMEVILDGVGLRSEVETECSSFMTFSPLMRSKSNTISISFSGMVLIVRFELKKEVV